MSAGRHTPGPWKVVTDAYGGLWGSGGEEEANARLIAQAPAYAAATQPVVDNLVGQDGTPDDDFIPVRAGDLRALNEAHLKAIGQ